MSSMCDRRAQTVMMARIRNEQRWIRRCLERVWDVAGHVVIWDDGSTDRTHAECILSLDERGSITELTGPNSVTKYIREDGATLHYIHSPYRCGVGFGDTLIPPELLKFQVNEIRDKNALWEYVKACVPNRKYILCMDGDEMLSKDFLRRAPATWQILDDGLDLLHLSFIYLWDDENKRRVDAIYGDSGVGYAKLNFPRLFTTQRWTEQEIFDSHFDWQGSKGGFHCGSIPRSQGKQNMKGGYVLGPVVHFGYIDNDLRQRKFVFYNEIDPNNVFEGEYKHIIGVPNGHAPGPVELVPWSDD